MMGSECKRRAKALKRNLERLSIPDIYENQEDFVQKYLFSKEDGNSVYSSMERAYDNAVVLRDDLFAFWGCLDDNVEDEECRNIIKCGKYLERLDLYMRLDYPYRMIEKEYNKFLNRLHKIRIHYNLSEIDTFNEIMNLGDGWRGRDDDRRGREPCLDRGVGWSVLEWTGFHS